MKVRPTLMFLGVLMSGTTLSDNTLAGGYAGLLTGVSFIELDSASFKPLLAGAFIGYRLDNGLGSEFDLRTGLTDDDDSSVNLELDYQASGYLTYSNVFNNRTFLTLGVGYATTKLDSSVHGSSFPGSQSYNGPAFLARLEEKLIDYPNIVLSLSYQRFYSEGDIIIQGASFGVAYDF